jgi:hypothetical protein
LQFDVLGFARIAVLRNMPKRDTLTVNCVGVAKVRARYGGPALLECTTLAKSDRLGPSLAVMGVTTNGRLCVSLLATDAPVEFCAVYRNAVLKHPRKAMGQRTP